MHEYEGNGAGLLSRLDEELGGGPRSWSDLILLKNRGPLRSAHALHGDRLSTRGCNALLLGPDGRPGHYLKVRSATNKGFKREIAAHTQLRNDAEVGHMVPSAKTFLHGPMRVLASDFLQGQSLDAILRREGKGGGWSRPVGDVLEASRPLWQALSRLSGAGDGLNGSATLQLAEEDLATLRQAGLSRQTSEVLVERMSRGRLPSVPQHGDFWPRNLLRVGESWRILDFESCGEVDLPLFDLFHLIRGSWGLVGELKPGAWIEHWADVDGRADSLGAFAGRYLSRMEMSQIESALVGYLVSLTTRLIRRGLSPKVIGPNLEEIERLPEILERGVFSRVVESSVGSGPT